MQKIMAAAKKGGPPIYVMVIRVVVTDIKYIKLSPKLSASELSIPEQKVNSV